MTMSSIRPLVVRDMTEVFSPEPIAQEDDFGLTKKLEPVTRDPWSMQHLTELIGLRDSEHHYVCSLVSGTHHGCPKYPSGITILSHYAEIADATECSSFLRNANETLERYAKDPTLLCSDGFVKRDLESGDWIICCPQWHCGPRYQLNMLVMYIRLSQFSEEDPESIARIADEVKRYRRYFWTFLDSQYALVKK